MNQGDYDQRTALHLSAAEGRVLALDYLVNSAGAMHSPVDRWGSTPLQDAIANGHEICMRVLVAYGGDLGPSATKEQRRLVDESSKQLGFGQRQGFSVYADNTLALRRRVGSKMNMVKQGSPHVSRSDSRGPTKATFDLPYPGERPARQIALRDLPWYRHLFAAISSGLNICLAAPSAACRHPLDTLWHPSHPERRSARSGQPRLGTRAMPCSPRAHIFGQLGFGRCGASFAAVVRRTPSTRGFETSPSSLQTGGAVCRYTRSIPGPRPPFEFALTCRATSVSRPMRAGQVVTPRRFGQDARASKGLPASDGFVSTLGYLCEMEHSASPPASRPLLFQWDEEALVRTTGLVGSHCCVSCVARVAPSLCAVRGSSNVVIRSRW